MKEEAELLWRLYQEHCAWERHHEAQRASMTTLFVAIAAGVLGVVTFDSHLNVADLPLTVFLAIQGFFGAVFAAKHYERFRHHQERANRYREQLDRLHPSAEVLKLRGLADNAVDDEFPHLRKYRLHNFWIGLHVLIAAFGGVLAVGVVLSWFP